MRHLVPESTTQGIRDPAALPAALTCEDPKSFAWSVIHTRHPRLVEQARDAHPYGPEQISALERLAAETVEGAVQPIRPDAHDTPAWTRWYKGYLGRRWDQTPFLWAESYFYRRLLDAIDFFAPGPWYWLDPFAHLKTAELADPALEAELAALDQLANDPEQRGSALLLAALWGNQSDLSFAAHAGRPNRATSEAALVVDDSTKLWSSLGDDARLLCLVADNAGRELLADLLLVDHLLQSGRVGQVVIHVKPTPYYVSDATTSDVAACLRRLAATPGHAAAASRRLRNAFRGGHVRLRTSWFYVAPLEFDAMPADLAADFASASMTMLKGDLNYRRVVGDRHWVPTTDLSVAGSYFPGPFAVLRTLKSEVVVGVSEAKLRELDTQRTGWRVNGNHAMIQVVT